MELSPQPGLPNVGPSLRGPASSAHLLNEEERGDESFAGGMEFAPEDTLHDTASTAPRVEEDILPVQEPTVTTQQDSVTDKSPSVSVLLPPVGGTQPSPMTGVISKPTITEDPLAFPSVDEDEPIDHSDGADATDDDGDQSGNNDNLGDDSDDPDDWDIPPPSSSDKASAYIPLPLTDPMIHETSTVTPLSTQQLIPPPAQVSEPPRLEVSTTTLPPTTLLTISLASTEVIDMPRSSNMGELMALQSSPSQLDIGVPSQATTPKSPAGLLLGSVSSEVSVPSPIAVLSARFSQDFS
ncbi:mucin-2-like [Asparagus officinalis]|uniref:mucin-2-like n=1 Tax=Asparagus officinalis TaxID=4686 RepID=UPI00098E8117|nr:mucin-2-like [Asparagus officinalis]